MPFLSEIRVDNLYNLQRNLNIMGQREAGETDGREYFPAFLSISAFHGPGHGHTIWHLTGEWDTLTNMYSSDVRMNCIQVPINSKPTSHLFSIFNKRWCSSHFLASQSRVRLSFEELRAGGLRHWQLRLRLQTCPMVPTTTVAWKSQCHLG